MIAIIKTGGKQLLVEEGSTIYIEKVDGEPGEEITFNEVLVLGEKIGAPFVDKAKVTGLIEKQGKHKKIVVYRHNAKSTHKRKLGHRQPYTRVKIIEMKG